MNGFVSSYLEDGSVIGPLVLGSPAFAMQISARELVEHKSGNVSTQRFPGARKSVSANLTSKLQFVSDPNHAFLCIFAVSEKSPSDPLTAPFGLRACLPDRRKHQRASLRMAKRKSSKIFMASSEGGGVLSQHPKECSAAP